MTGYQSKRESAADKLREPVANLWECLGRWSAYLVQNGKQADCAPPSWLVDAITNATMPPQREWVGLTKKQLAECIDHSIYHTAWSSDVDLGMLATNIEKVLKENNHG